MTSESWLKITFPAFPVGFTIFGVWFYWGENPISLLPSAIAFFGVVTLFYVFSHFDVPGKRYPLITMAFTSVLWLLACITAHSLGKFVASASYNGPLSVFRSHDLYFSYIAAFVSGGLGFRKFVEFEPQIAEQIARDRAILASKG